MGRKTILRINVIYYLLVAMLFIWGMFAFPQYWHVARILLIVISVLFVGISLAFSKCPHCGRGLSPGYKGTTCPHCGKPLY